MRRSNFLLALVTNHLLTVEIIIEGRDCVGSDFIDVALYLALLHKQYACGDVDGVGEVV